MQLCTKYVGLITLSNWTFVFEHVVKNAHQKDFCNDGIGLKILATI